MGFVSDIFGGGGGGGGSTSTSQAANNVTVNTTTNVDTTPIGQAMVASSALAAGAVATVSQNDASMFQAATTQYQQTITALKDHLDAESKANLLVAVATAAALFLHGSK